MSEPSNGGWPSADVGLPFRGRPPTVDEALPYSPFSSIFPFTPDIIPFPSAGPPTPPTTLTSEQQSSAKRALDILNAEVKGQSNTSQHLQQTLHDLQALLNPDDLSQFQFKSHSKFAATSSDGAKSHPANGSASYKPLSPFASMLLKNTNVSYVLSDSRSSKVDPRNRVSQKETAPQAAQRANAPNSIAAAQNSQLQYGASAPPSSKNSIAPPSPAVVISSNPSNARRVEYTPYDTVEKADGISKKQQDASRAQAFTSTMRPHERENAERKMKDLQDLITELEEEKDIDGSDKFRTVEVEGAELAVLRSKTLTNLTETVTNVFNLGCFSSIPVEQVLSIQSLCESTITATVELALEFGDGDDEHLGSHLKKAQTGLRACKLVLQTMTEYGDDRRICSEDLVQTIIKVLKHVLTSCIIPIVESRRSGSSSDLFGLATKLKPELLPVLRLCGHILSLMASLINKLNLTESALSPIMYVSIDIIFVQNGDKEAESALGIQKFESVRQKSMDVLAQIFASHGDQRDSITHEVLANLEKLPDKKASARQFKSAREAPIMLVSALFMRMIQVSASTWSHEKTTQTEATKNGHDGDDEDDGDSDSDSEGERRKSTHARLTNGVTESPHQIAIQLRGRAKVTAGNIANFLVNRALNVSKSGDKPFRNLLDLFIDDFCNVLGSPEWPAASVMLEVLLGVMITIMNSIKEKGVQAADMALAAIGSMGCGIIDFTHRLKTTRRSLDISHSELSSRLVPLADDALASSINIKDVLALNGPYRIVLEALSKYLHPQGSQGDQSDPLIQSLSGYYVISWTHAFYQAFPPTDSDEPQPPLMIDLERHLKKMIADPKWLSREYKFQNVTDAECQVAAGIITLQEPFCKYLQHLITQLINATQHQSAKVKSRGMTSVTQLIEKDPQILNEQTFVRVAGLINDTSPLVRENTLSLISKCLERDPSLERHCLLSILKIMTDPANGPKRRAIKLLKDIYLSTTSKDKKLTIATELLLPILDDDKTVADLTRQTFEDIWLGSSTSAAKADSSQLKLGRENRVLLLVDTVQNIQGRQTHQQALETFFKSALSPTAKNATANLKICKDYVADMVEEVIGNDTTAREKSQSRILQTLSIFAKVNPKLFTADQVQLLKLYVKNLASTEDLDVFRPTVMIFRYVFPSFPSLQEAFLEEVRSSLAAVFSKLASYAGLGQPGYKETLLDVAHCSWIISPLVKGDPPRVKSGLEKLMVFICSVMIQLTPLTTCPKEKIPNERKKIMSYMIILGIFGKVCDFDKHVDAFRTVLVRHCQVLVNSKKASADQMQRFLTWKGPSVAVLFLDLILPFTRQAWDSGIREQALCSIGEICQQNSGLFTRADVDKAFKLPFINQDLTLVRVVLTQLRDYLSIAERRSETGAEIAVGEGAVHGAERLGTSFAGSDSESATNYLARNFLSDIVSIALGQSDDLAVVATEIVISISRQGLVHPKECGAALVALSTSSIPQIAQKASFEHHRVHLAHETMFEKEYVRAVTLAYNYQKNVFDDPHGANETTYKPKMHLLFDAFKSGSRKTLKNFVTNMFRKMNFDLTKLDTSGLIPEAVLFTRFCLENFAFFDYARVDEVYHVLATIESIVLKQTGPSVALAIESDLPKQEAEGQPLQPGIEEPHIKAEDQETKLAIDDSRLRQLAVASMILHMMWETRTFIRRAYNLQGKITPKDMQKPAMKMNFITGKDLWEHFTTIMMALGSRESMEKQCRDVAELINIDKEHGVEDEDVEANEQLAKAAAGYETPDEGERGDTPGSTKGKKRKSNSVIGNTPKKPKNRPLGSKGKKRNSKTPDGEEDWD